MAALYGLLRFGLALNFLVLTNLVKIVLLQKCQVRIAAPRLRAESSCNLLLGQKV